ncbi:hypothetical protein B0H13DRAFT_2077641, partial [Mycena leptocephala]
MWCSRSRCQGSSVPYSFHVSSFLFLHSLPLCFALAFRFVIHSFIFLHFSYHLFPSLPCLSYPLAPSSLPYIPCHRSPIPLCDISLI